MFNLITSYYTPPNKERQTELNQCLTLSGPKR